MRETPDFIRTIHKPLVDLSDLAFFGAPPLFDTPRHVNRPQTPDRTAFDALIDQVWESHWFTNNGPLVQELERRLSEYLDVPHCVLMANATIAMDLVMEALNIRGEVLLPAFTFISTAHLLHLRALTPVFCDVGADMTIDPAECAARITDRTGAVVATHIWGSPCNINALQSLCDDAKIPLLFDAAHAFGARYDGHRIGRFGRAEIFSLHATKAFHAGEGGLVTTTDATLAARLRLSRNFGFSDLDKIEFAGVNAKMSELHAALGLCNFDAFPATCAAAKDIHATYVHELQGLAGITLKCPDADEDNNHHYVVIEIDANAFGVNRDILLALLTAENILARRYFFPGAHRSPPHQEQTQVNQPELPVTDAFCLRILLLPSGAAATQEDVIQICNLLRFIQVNAAQISAALPVLLQPKQSLARP